MSSKDIVWPGGIAIDYTTMQVYFIDAAFNAIYRMNYNGEQRTKIFTDTTIDLGYYHGYGLDIANGNIYWSDWRDSAIFGIDKTDPTKEFKVTSVPTILRPTGDRRIQDVDISIQPLD